MLPKNERGKFELVYDLKIKGKKESKGIVTKILKMDENNQCSKAMKKPLPLAASKTRKIPTLRKFNIILNNISHKDKIGHLFVVDIKFCEMSGNTFLFNELYTPIFKK